ncbi:MAG: amidohydrolase [Clostridia bacterium]|nr:amidohydrolase [Clostridia bacterium]
MPKTVELCRERLAAMGIEARELAGGLVAEIGSGKECILLRADMDALPIREETGLEYASESGNMHACGHDMHTAMLLGASQLIKEREQELNVKVRLCFQPGEEILEGARRMISAGLLSEPKPFAAMMLHVLTGTDYKTGTIIIPSEGIGASGADFFRVTIKGEGCHGSAPHLGKDPIICAASIITAVSNITARELPGDCGQMLTIGTVRAGDAANAIPDSCVLSGSLRSYEDDKRSYVKERLVSVCENVARAFRCEAEVEFVSGAPSFLNDDSLVNACRQIFSTAKPPFFAVPTGSRGNGSEDFAYVSRVVPSVMLALAAGEAAEGYTEPLHSPRARFDEGALPYGAAAYAAFALDVRKEQ